MPERTIQKSYYFLQNQQQLIWIGRSNKSIVPKNNYFVHKTIPNYKVDKNIQVSSFSHDFF